MLETVTKENFNQLLGRFSTSELENLTDKFPYFHQAHLLLAKRYQQENNPKFDEQLQLAVLYTQDREFLFSLFSGKNSTTSVETAFTLTETVTEPKVEVLKNVEIENKEKVTEEAGIEEITPTKVLDKPFKEDVVMLSAEIITQTEYTKPTEETVLVNEPHTFDEWLNLFSKPGNIKVEEVKEEVAEQQAEELEQLIMSNLPLHELVEEETHYSKGLDVFIEEQKLKHKPKEIKVIMSETELAPELITETIAKVYEAQKKYAKAIRAYEILTLKYPEKNDFFAARIIELKNSI